MIRCICAFLLLFSACNEPSSDSSVATRAIPAANTVVASGSMRIPDALNELYYSIEVVATPQSTQGVYEVLVRYGHNDASTRITMPVSEQPLIPVLRKKPPNEYIIGFRLPGDTAFKDYFQIRADRGKIGMKYLKAYSFKP